MKVNAKDILKNRKECTEFYSRTVSNKFSHYISAFCINRNIAPNTITAMMLISAFICSLLLLLDNNWFILAGAFLLFTVNIFDTSDGEVARYTNNMSSSGIYYDKLFQLIVDILIFVVIGFKQYIFFDSLFYVIPMGIIVLFYVIDNYSKEIFIQLYNEENCLDSKSTKLKLSYDKASKLQFFAHISSSNTGFFHLYWIFIFLDIIFSFEYYFQFFYISYFMFLQVLKMLNRQKKIIKMLGK